MGVAGLVDLVGHLEQGMGDRDDRAFVATTAPELHVLGAI